MAENQRISIFRAADESRNDDCFFEKREELCQFKERRKTREVLVRDRSQDDTVQKDQLEALRTKFGWPKGNISTKILKEKLAELSVLVDKNSNKAGLIQVLYTSCFLPEDDLVDDAAVEDDNENFGIAEDSVIAGEYQGSIVDTPSDALEQIQNLKGLLIHTNVELRLLVELSKRVDEDETSSLRLLELSLKKKQLQDNIRERRDGSVSSSLNKKELASILWSLIIA